MTSLGPGVHTYTGGCQGPVQLQQELEEGVGSRKTLFLGPGKDPSVLVPQSCLTLCDPMLLCPWNSPGKNSGVGSHSLLQGIFRTQRLNPGLLHCRQIFFLPYEPAGKPQFFFQMKVNFQKFNLNNFEVPIS